MRRTQIKPVGEERHGALLHHALVAGLLAVTTLAVIGTVGAKVLGRLTGGAGTAVQGGAGESTGDMPR